MYINIRPVRSSFCFDKVLIEWHANYKNTILARSLKKLISCEAEVSEVLKNIWVLITLLDYILSPGEFSS